MKKFLTLFKFELMSNTSRCKDDKIFSRIIKIITLLIGEVLIAGLFLLAINAILNVFISSDMQHEFITIFSFFMMLLHLVIGISMAIKVFFTKVDLSILKFPVAGVEVFLAKFLYLYLKQLVFVALITVPTLILFAVKTTQGIGFYLMLIPNALFLPILPLLFATLLAVPVMFIIKIFKNKFLILLLAYTAILVLGFMLYIGVLKFIVNIFESGDFANVFNESTIFSIKQFSTYLYLPLLFKNSLLLYNFWKSAVVNLAILLFLGAIVYTFAERHYYNLLISSKKELTFERKTNFVNQTPTAALMTKEFKNIFRSTNYAFQYLTIVFTTPLMVYFTSRIAENFGASILGEGVLQGIVVLVLIMFLSMGTSFSATSITREGGNFFLTKIIPVKFTQQIFVKFLIYLIISIPAIFVSCFVLGFAGLINYLSAFLIAISLSFVIVGNICNSIIMDIKSPQFQYLENGEVASNNKNITTSIGIGFVISFFMGIGGIMLSYFIGLPSIYCVLFGFGVPFATIEIFKLFFRLEKRYNEIEV